VRIWRNILVATLVLTLFLTSCNSSADNEDLSDYLSQVDSFMVEISDAESTLFDILENPNPFGEVDIFQELISVRDQYNELLGDFRVVEYPTEATKLREYTIDIINYRKQAVDELILYVDTFDTTHYDKAESYALNADELLPLAADEWDRLADIVEIEEDDGTSIWEIFLWILGVGVAVTVALFVLQMTVGVGFGVIAGIGVGISALINKIRGR